MLVCIHIVQHLLLNFISNTSITISTFSFKKVYYHRYIIQEKYISFMMQPHYRLASKHFVENGFQLGRLGYCLNSSPCANQAEHGIPEFFRASNMLMSGHLFLCHPKFVCENETVFTYLAPSSSTKTITGPLADWTS